MELYELTALKLARQLRAGTVTQAEAIATAAGRTAACQSGNNAFITVANSLAPVPALSASPLAGVSMVYKDTLYTRGMRTTCAPKILEDFIPCYDATAVERLTAAGAVSMGKLNLDEFAMDSICEASYYGSVKNPWDLTRPPDGSSDGAAAVVVAGEVRYIIGSGTGDFIRQPAVHCGVTEMKPIYGFTSWYGLVAYVSSLDQAGPIARSAADCAAMLESIHGRDSRDVNSLELLAGGLLCALAGDVRGRRVGPPVECLDDALESGMIVVVRAVAGVLRARGAVVEECPLPLLDYAAPAYYILICAEASSNLARFDGVKYGWRVEGRGSLKELYRRACTEGFDPEVKKRTLLGTFIPPADCYDFYYKKALQARARLKAVFDVVFQRYDLLLTPVAPITVPRLGEGLADPSSLYLNDIYTIPTNLVDLPALSVLCGFDWGGLSIGTQLIGPALGDLAVLDAAHTYQQETNWHRRHPDMPASARGDNAL